MWPRPNGRSSGSTSAHSSRARGQRVRNRQPDGGFTGLGSSPRIATSSLARSRRRVGHRDRLDQRVGVRVGRSVVDVVAGPELDELAEVHHPDPVRQVLDDREVVGDHDRGHAVLGLQALHQVQDLRADRHVERADRLVGDDHLRLEHQRPGQRDPLPLTAGELVRVALERVASDSPTSSSSRAIRSSCSRRVADPLDHERLAQDRLTRASADRATRTDPGTSSAGRGERGAAPVRGDGTPRSPSSMILPASGFSTPTTSLPSVVLPQPDSPTSPSVSPSSTCSVTSDTALTEATLRLQHAGGDRVLADRVLDLEQVPVRALAARCPRRWLNDAISGRGVIGPVDRMPAGEQVLGSSPRSGGSCATALVGRERQRGAKRQPGGGLVRSGGRPGIVTSALRSSWSSRGIEPSSACV